MKIAVVLDQYFTYDGGAFTFQGEVLRALASMAAESAHQFIVFSPVAPPQPSIGLEWQQYPKPSLGERALLKLFRYWPGLEDRLAWRSGLERRIQHSGAQLAWFLSPRLRALRMPYVALVLDLQHRLQPQFPEVSARGEWQVREAHYQRSLAHAHAIVAGTEVGRDEIMRFYDVPADKILLLPHPTPQRALEHSALPDTDVLVRLGLQPGYLLYPAQLWPHKNHANLLAALAHLLTEGFAPKLVLTGVDFGAQRAIRKQIARQNLQEQVHLLGFVSQEDLYTLYRHALALTYVSFFGPENLPPLEAFALGCPVLAARVSGAEEQLGAAALLVNPADPRAIAAGIRSLLQDAGLRQRLQAAGHQRAAAWTSAHFVRGAWRYFDDFAQAGAT